MWLFWKPDRIAAFAHVQKGLELNNLLLFDYWEKYYFFDKNEALKCSIKLYQVYAHTHFISKSCIYFSDSIQVQMSILNRTLTSLFKFQIAHLHSKSILTILFSVMQYKIDIYM